MQLLWAALAGMVVYLDTTAIAQIMICQPIIACPLWGYFVGEPETGLIIGAAFQLIWLGNLQVGAAKFAEGNVGAFIAVVLATRFCEANTDSYSITLLIVIIIGLVAAHVGSNLAPIVRRIVGRIVPKFVLTVEQGKDAQVRTWFMLAVAVHLLAGFLYTIVWLIAGNILLKTLLGESVRLWLTQTFSDFPTIGLLTLLEIVFGAGCAIAFGVLVRRKTISIFLITSILFSVAVIWYLYFLVELTYSTEMGCLL